MLSEIGGKGRIKLNKGIGPKRAAFEHFFYMGKNPTILNLDDAANVGIVILNEVLAKLENIHGAFLVLLNSVGNQRVIVPEINAIVNMFSETA